MRLRLEPLLQRGYQSRLADARLACKQNHAAFTLRGLVPAAQKQLQFLFTPYQRSKAGLVLRLETGFAPRLRQVPAMPGLDRPSP